MRNASSPCGIRRFAPLRSDSTLFAGIKAALRCCDVAMPPCRHIRCALCSVQLSCRSPGPLVLTPRRTLVGSTVLTTSSSRAAGAHDAGSLTHYVPGQHCLLAGAYTCPPVCITANTHCLWNYANSLSIIWMSGFEHKIRALSAVPTFSRVRR